MLEAAPYEERGGNSHYTGGAFRFAYSSVEDLRQIYRDYRGATRERRFRHLFRRPVFRRHVRAHRATEPIRSFAKYSSDLASKPRNGCRAGRQAVAGPWSAGLQGRRQVQGLGWPPAPYLAGGVNCSKALYRSKSIGIPIHYETPAVALIQKNGASPVSSPFGRKAHRNTRRGRHAGVRWL